MMTKNSDSSSGSVFTLCFVVLLNCFDGDLLNFHIDQINRKQLKSQINLFHKPESFNHILHTFHCIQYTDVYILKIEQKQKRIFGSRIPLTTRQKLGTERLAYPRVGLAGLTDLIE